MVRPAARRAVARLLVEEHQLSERQSCRIVRVWRGTYRYRSRRGDDEALRLRLRELAERHPRVGCPQLYKKLRRQGVVVNHKKVERIYREEGLKLKRKRRKGVAQARVPAPLPSQLNERYSIDFMWDATVSGRTLKLFNVVDDFSREALAMEVDISIPAIRVVRVLEEIAVRRGCYAKTIVLDNGPEFISDELDQWAHRKGVKLDFIDPGKPVQNCFVESFNGRVRQECLDVNWFVDLADARRTISAWMKEYNEERDHGSLGMTPCEFAAGRKCAVETAENANSAFPSVPTAPAATGEEIREVFGETKLEISSANNPAELTL